MTLAEHTKASNAAIKHVRLKLHIGAATCPNDVVSANSKGLLLNQAVVDQQRTSYKVGPNQTYADAVREVAEQTHIGNCGEQSLVAFEYLRWEYQRLDLAVLASQAHPGGLLGIGALKSWNHQFVVIGVKLKARDTIVLDKKKAPSWPDAVICDPWLWGVGTTVNVSNLAEWSAYCDKMLQQTIKDTSPTQGKFLVTEVN